MMHRLFFANHSAFKGIDQGSERSNLQTTIRAGKKWFNRLEDGIDTPVEIVDSDGNALGLAVVTSVKWRATLDHVETLAYSLHHGGPTNSGNVKFALDQLYPDGHGRFGYTVIYFHIVKWYPTPAEIRDLFVSEVMGERQYQLEGPKWDDSLNGPGDWVTYINQYATRWAFPRAFDTGKYDFKTCMIKVAALAMAAYEWAENNGVNLQPPQEAHDQLITEKEIPSLLDYLESAGCRDGETVRLAYDDSESQVPTTDENLEGLRQAIIRGYRDLFDIEISDVIIKSKDELEQLVQPDLLDTLINDFGADDVGLQELEIQLEECDDPKTCSQEGCQREDCNG